MLNLATKQVDYANAFIQAALKEDVYVELPKEFSQADQDQDFVLKLNKSLYGLKQALLVWFERLRDGLLE